MSSSHDQFPVDSNREFRLERPAESPFLDEALFAGIEVESAETWQARPVKSQLESPFQYAFELQQDEAIIDEEMPAFEASALPVMGERLEFEIVDPPDNRRRVSPTLQAPYRFLCSLEFYIENLGRGPGDQRWHLARKGTGFLIGPSTVLTAAHLLGFRNKQGAWQQFGRIVVTPGRNGRLAPFGSTEAVNWLPSQNWNPNNRLPQIWDFAVIRLRDTLGNRTYPVLDGRRLGWWGSADWGDGTTRRPLNREWLSRKIRGSGRRIMSAGYPLNRCGTLVLHTQDKIDLCARDQQRDWASTQWWGDGRVQHVDRPSGFLLHNIDTTEGQSGAPVWYYYHDRKRRQQRRWLVGIHISATDVTDANGRARKLNVAIWFQQQLVDRIAALEAQLFHERRGAREVESVSTDREAVVIDSSFEEEKDLADENVDEYESEADRFDIEAEAGEFEFDEERYEDEDVEEAENELFIDEIGEIERDVDSVKETFSDLIAKNIGDDFEIISPTTKVSLSLKCALSALKIDADRSVRLNSSLAKKWGWEIHTGDIEALLGFTTKPGRRDFARAVARWQCLNNLDPADGIIGSNTWAMMRTAIDIENLSIKDHNDQADIFAATLKILHLLNRKFKSTDTQGLQDRRKRLKNEFTSISFKYAMSLYDRLLVRRKDDSLSTLFYYRLAAPTRSELIAILGRRFFTEYELFFNTAPNDRFSTKNNPRMTISQKDERKEDINAVIGDVENAPGPLWRRLFARQDAALKGKIPTSLPPNPAGLDTVTKRVSDAQIELFGKWFPDGKGSIRIDSFQRCFEQFANGELRNPAVKDHPGLNEPNGSVFFHFAEFAFLCIDLGISKSIWTNLLRTFVKIQEIMMHVYRENPTSPPPPVGAPLPALGPEIRDVGLTALDGRGFSHLNFKRTGASVLIGEGQSDLERKKALRRKYDGLDVAGLKEAARDNLRRALLIP